MEKEEALVESTNAKCRCKEGDKHSGSVCFVPSWIVWMQDFRGGSAKTTNLMRVIHALLPKSESMKQFCILAAILIAMCEDLKHELE